MNTREWIGVNSPNHNYGDGAGSGWGRTLGSGCQDHTTGSGHGVLGIGINYAGFDAGNGSGVELFYDSSGRSDGFGAGVGDGPGLSCGDGSGR